MYEQLVAGLRSIESDHRQLVDIFHDIETGAPICLNEKSCTLSQCAQRPHCNHMVREHFHRVLFAMIGHFGREERLLREHAPLANFEEHAAAHAKLKDATQQAIAAFADDKDAGATYEKLRALARMYREHHELVDTKCRLLLVGGQQPAVAGRPLPAMHAAMAAHQPDVLPLTGNDAIDREHADLYDTLRQAGAICQIRAPNCQQCDSGQQESCTSSAVELVANVLKSMVEHFRNEEVLLRRHATAEETRPHLREHAEFSHRMSLIVGDYEDNNTAMLLYRLTETLRADLRRHVIEYDLPLSRNVSSGASNA